MGIPCPNNSAKFGDFFSHNDGKVYCHFSVE